MARQKWDERAIFDIIFSITWPNFKMLGPFLFLIISTHKMHHIPTFKVISSKCPFYDEKMVNLKSRFFKKAVSYNAISLKFFNISKLNFDIMFITLILC